MFIHVIAHRIFRSRHARRHSARMAPQINFKGKSEKWMRNKPIRFALTKYSDLCVSCGPFVFSVNSLKYRFHSVDHLALSSWPSHQQIVVSVLCFQLICRLNYHWHHGVSTFRFFCHCNLLILVSWCLCFAAGSAKEKLGAIPFACFAKASCMPRHIVGS